jgi:hypothetical protein
LTPNKNVSRGQKKRVQTRIDIVASRSQLLRARFLSIDGFGEVIHLGRLPLVKKKKNKKIYFFSSQTTTRVEAKPTSNIHG